MNPGPGSASELRSFGYPLLIWLGQLLLQDSTLQAVRIVHTVIGFISLSTCMLLFRRLVSPLLVGIIYVVLILPIEVFYLSMLTEWTVINGLFVLAALVWCYLESRRKSVLATCGVLTFFISFVKPSLLFLVVTPFILVFLHPQRTRLRDFFIGGLGVLFVVTWMTLNLVRIGSFSMSPFGGLSLFAVTSLVADIDDTPKDPQLENFSVAFKTLKATNEDMPSFDPLVLEPRYNRNLWQYAESIRRQSGMSYVALNQILARYGLNVLRNHPGEVLAFVVHGFIRHFRFYLSWLTLLWPTFAGLILLRRERPCSFSVKSMVAFSLLVHFGYMILAAMTNIIFYRLWATTYIPALFVAGVAVGSVLFPKKREHLSFAESEEGD